MIIIDLLSDVIPALHKTDTGTNALNWMDVFKVSHLPVVDGSEYLGLVSEQEIYDMNNPDDAIDSQIRVMSRPFIYDNQHIIEAMQPFAENNLSVLPVLDVEDKYLGVITLPDLSHELAQMMAAEKGAIIVLEMSVRDYSLSQISQIVEGNDTKIVSLFVQNQSKTDNIYVTIKFNRTDISPVIQTFERYSYRIVQVFSSDREIDTMLEDRYNSFMKFMSI
ncbi:MAG: CBS domain-containing protein [Salinivirgaceae bacterium]|nr:CBS domain-containing protein [Salinivirgaceae bacterium]